MPEQGANASGRITVIAGGLAGRPLLQRRRAVPDPIPGLATYTVPEIDVQLSGTWRNNPGDALEANYIANNA